MLAHVETCTVRGIEALPLRVEVALASGLPSFTVVGLAQGAVREGRERVGSALRSTGFGLPHRRITVNLAPADVRKTGTGFDLPIALGILAASGVIPDSALRDRVFIGELGLDGALRPVPGVIPAALLARSRRWCLGVPAACEPEARLVAGVDVLSSQSLADVVEVLSGRKASRVAPARAPGSTGADSVQGVPLDLADVQGQGVARRALEIVAAGSHNLLMVGPPGVGKTMLARRLPGILPAMEPDEALELARVRSVAGLPNATGALPARPFRAPHHSVSYAGLVGGGSPLRPGEISLAHHGVLFLDELPEFRRDVVEVLRQPLEEGAVTLVRVDGSVRFPARFILVGAMNPCPCGHLGDGSDLCSCDDVMRARYRRRVSGPLLDRIDLTVETPPPRGASTGRAESSAEVAARVQAARVRQSERFSGQPGIFANGQMTRRLIDAHCPLGAGAARLLDASLEQARLSLRGRDRVLRVARTIADLERADTLAEHHVAEALQYRRAGVGSTVAAR